MTNSSKFRVSFWVVLVRIWEKHYRENLKHNLLSPIHKAEELLESAWFRIRSHMAFGGISRDLSLQDVLR